MKKKMYYQMKQKTLERGYNETVKKLEEKKENVKSVSTTVLKKLNFAIKEVRDNCLIEFYIYKIDFLLISKSCQNIVLQWMCKLAANVLQKSSEM